MSSTRVPAEDRKRQTGFQFVVRFSTPEVEAMTSHVPSTSARDWVLVATFRLRSAASANNQQYTHLHRHYVKPNQMRIFMVAI